MDARRLPVGIQDFPEIIEGNYAYVDKTGFVYDLALRYKYVFLNRPRRFGKSLLTSTFESYFSGRKELFEGLEAGRLEKDWTEYPVLHFDLRGAFGDSIEGLENHLSYLLQIQESKYNIAPNASGIGERMDNLIRQVAQNSGRKAVILVDEYDKPLLDVMADEGQLSKVRMVMRKFYYPIKGNDSSIRFAFITGITKFSQLSIFSEINNLENISIQDRYSSICGISQQELDAQLGDQVASLASQWKMDEAKARKYLKDVYDGYHFSANCPDIYNPFSLLKTFSEGTISSHWFETGTPIFLFEQLKKFSFHPQDFSSVRAPESVFNAPTENMKSMVPLLYQSGYITIKGYDEMTRIYTLDIPNREVKSGLMENLVSYVIGPSFDIPSQLLVAEMFRKFQNEDISGVLDAMKEFLGTIPYTQGANYEGHYQSILYVLFSMLSKYTDVEVRTPRGRVDVVTESPGHIYVIETKLDSTEEDAMAQIDGKNYPERFSLKGKPVVKVAVNFSSSTRNIEGYTIG